MDGRVEPPPGLGVLGFESGVDGVEGDGSGLAVESPLLCEGRVPVPFGTSWVPLR